MALDFSGQAEPVTPKPAGTLDFSGAAEPVDVVGAGENAARQFTGGGGRLLRAAEQVISATPVGLARDAVGGIMDFFAPGSGFNEAAHPLDTAGRRAVDYGTLQPTEIPEDFTADVTGKLAGVVPDLAGALIGGGASVPAGALTAARGVPFIGRALEATARGAPVAGAMTGIQAANLSDELTPEEKAIEIAKAGGLNLLMAGLPVALTNNPVLRPITAAGIGAGTSAGATALAGQDQDAATNIVGALTGLALGGRANAPEAPIRPAGDYITPDMVDAFMGGGKQLAPVPVQRGATDAPQPRQSDIIDAEFTDAAPPKALDFLAAAQKGAAEPFKALPAPEAPAPSADPARAAPNVRKPEKAAFEDPAITTNETAIATQATPDVVAPPKRIIDPDERHITAGKQSVAEYAAEHNLTPEQAASAEKRFVKPLSRDPVTGLHKRDELVPTIEAAQESGQPAVYVEADMKNLGGLNAHIGSNKADAGLRKFGETVRAELESVGATVGIRKGGDEGGFVVTGADVPTVEAAMSRARTKYAEAMAEYSQVPRKGGTEPVGVGLHYGVSEIRPGESPDDIMTRADILVERRKKGEAYEQPRSVEAVETGTPERNVGLGSVEAPAGSLPQARGNVRAEALPERVAPAAQVPAREVAPRSEIDDTPDPPLDIRYGKNRLTPKPPKVEEVADADLTPAERSSFARQSTVVAEQEARTNGAADAKERGFHEAVGKVLEGAGSDVEFIRGKAGLPKNLQEGVQRRLEARGGKGETVAVFDPKTGRVFVDTDAVRSPEDAAWHAAHEIAGHKGLRGSIGDKPALRSAMALARQNPTVAKVAAAIAGERKSGDEHLMTEEALAELAAASRTGNYDRIKSRYGVDVPEGVRAGVKSAITRFIERIKAMFAKLGGKFTDAQVRELLEGAWRYVKERPAKGGEPPADDDFLESYVPGSGKAPKLENRFKELAKGRGFIESGTDVLRGDEAFEPLAKDIETYHDDVQRRTGEINAVLREPTLKATKTDQKQFSEYMAAAQNGRKGDANRIFANGSPNLQAMVKGWRKVADDTGAENQRIGIKVHDPKVGGVRPIGKIGPDYWPRKLQDSVQKALRNPEKYKAEWDRTWKALVRDGFATDEADAAKYLRSSFGDQTGNDYFGAIEKARGTPLPEDLLDYSWKVGLDYAANWSRRASQIENFGQRLPTRAGPLKDSFEDASDDSADPMTQQYIRALQRQIYGEAETNLQTQSMQTLSTVATGLQLGNPLTSARNAIGGAANNVTVFGVRNSAKALVEMAKDLEAAKKEAWDKGILQDDYTTVLDDAQEMDVPHVAREFTRIALKYGGQQFTEHGNRIHAMLAAKLYLRGAVDTFGKKPDSAAAASFASYLKRQGVDTDKLVQENGSGPETDRFVRRAVNDTQFSYNLTQSPAFMGTPFGKFFLKYQKWGTQMNRMIWRNVLKPIVDVARGRNTVEYTVNGKTHTRKTSPVDAVKNLLRFALVAAPAGYAATELAEWAFGTQSAGPDESEIKKALEDNKNLDALLMTGQLAFESALANGAFGFFGNYAKLGRDYAERQRTQDPTKPAGIAPVLSLLDFGTALYDQHGQGAWRALDDSLSTAFSGYRTIRRGGAGALAGLGSDTDFALNEKARRTFMHAKKMTRRYADANGIEAKRRVPSSFATTPMTPINRSIREALLRGDVQDAKDIADQHEATLKTQGELASVRASMAASVRAGQPSIVSAAPSNAERREFFRWLKEHVTADEYAEIEALDDTYRSAAIKAGFMKASDAKKEKREDAARAKKRQALE